MSALGRMAVGDHRHVTVGSGDTVVLASSLVPGNETAVYRVINQLSRAGAFVVHKDVAQGARLRPLARRRAALRAQRGEAAQLHAGARRVAAPAGACPARASSPGCPADRIVLCEDGDVVDLVDGVATVVGHSSAGTSMWTVWPSAMSASRC